jgi:Bacterial extracellular solute-binding proteins, family 3
MGKFRLNAPQTDSDFDVEGSMPFGGIGDKIENPTTSTEFNLHGSHGSNHNVIPNQIGTTTTTTTTTGSQNLVSLANFKDSSARTGIKRGESITGGKNRDDENKVITEPEEEAPNTTSTTTRRSIRWLIIIGIMSVLLLVGLIVAVSLALTRDDNDPSADSSSNGGADSDKNGGDTSGSSSGSNSNLNDVPSSDTTLGLIYKEGILRCGVPVEQRGFASVNTTTGRMEGFDADLCRAVAAGIFGTDNLDDRVEFVPVSAFERWSSLQERKYDVLARTTTHTMEREVLEVRKKKISSHLGLVL